MLHLALLTSAFLAPALRAPNGSARTSSPLMMPSFFDELLSGLQKPGAPQIEVKEPNGAIIGAGKGMPALAALFSAEANLQAAALNLGSYDEEEVQREIEATVRSAPVVIYTYGLSPFSTEALAVLESTGCKLKKVELGLEWFTLGPRASATRVELRKLYGQGSLPHIFVGGKWIGGLATGADGGLAGLVERDELVSKLKAARAL